MVGLGLSLSGGEESGENAPDSWDTC